MVLWNTQSSGRERVKEQFLYPRISKEEDLTSERAQRCKDFLNESRDGECNSVVRSGWENEAGLVSGGQRSPQTRGKGMTKTDPCPVGQ
jgi:hypothetical protein